MSWESIERVSSLRLFFEANEANFDFAVNDKIADRADSRRWMSTEDFLEDFVKRLEVAGISQNDGDVHDVFDRIARLVDDLQAIGNGKLRLFYNASLHNLPISHRCLARHIQPTGSLHST